MLERSVRGALTSAANSAAVSPSTWGLIAELNQSLGFPDSARDARRKQVQPLTPKP